MKKLLLLLSLGIFLFSCGSDDDNNGTDNGGNLNKELPCVATYTDSKEINGITKFYDNGEYLIKISLAAKDKDDLDVYKYPVQFRGKYSQTIRNEILVITLSEKSDVYYGYWHNGSFMGKAEETDKLSTILSTKIEIKGENLKSISMGGVITLK